MSNLGGYQKITTAAKRVGGPGNLISLVFVGGMVFYAMVKKGGVLIYRGIKKRRNAKDLDPMEIIEFTVTKDGIEDSGLEFSIGDKFKVLACDGEAILIEKIGTK